MLSALALLTIPIGIDPEIVKIGDLTLTWHGVFTALGIAVGVFVAVIMGRRLGFTEDDVYSVALIAIPAAIIGARALFVVERWGTAIDDWVDIFRINEGGISIYGAVLGGMAGGAIYGWVRKLPIRRGLDASGFGLSLAMGIGRIGDLINGEHFAKLSNLPWAVRYTDINNPSVAAHPLDECIRGQFVSVEELCAQHPAVGYEMVGDFLLFGLLFLAIRYLRRDGVAFFGLLFFYSLMRLGVSELRLDSREIIWGLTTPQVTALFVIPLSLLGILYCWRAGRPASETPPAAVAPAPATGPPQS